LITFGCSWTYGVGVNYQYGMNKEVFEKDAWSSEICDQLSWRGVLGRQFDLTNINFSSSGSSNQRQFRLAREFFPTDKFKQLQTQFNRIIVLWGITSTSRNEIYSLKNESITNIFYHQETELSKFFLLNCYSHIHEVSELCQHMTFWEDYFSLLNVENYWFDTLNTHNYNAVVGDTKPLHILDAGKQPRDLMSWLCQESGMTLNPYSYDWENDDGRVDYLKLKNIINPISMHPTQQSHEKLADYFSERIKFN
jgi:hypothetical protein